MEQKQLTDTKVLLKLGLWEHAKIYIGEDCIFRQIDHQVIEVYNRIDKDPQSYLYIGRYVY